MRHYIKDSYEAIRISCQGFLNVGILEKFTSEKGK